MNKMDFLEGKVSLYGGDSREVLKQIPDNHFDAIVSDPPYGLLFMAKAWDSLDGAAFATEFWQQIYRVLKPGGHVVAFSGTRSYHRLAVAIEDSGFEIRDMLSWNYGAGFPKSHNINKALKAKGLSCNCHTATPYDHNEDEAKNLHSVRYRMDAEGQVSSGAQSDVRPEVQGHIDKQESDSCESEAYDSVRDLRDVNSQTGVEVKAKRKIVLQRVVPEQVICGAAEAVRGERQGEEESRQGYGAREKPGMEGRRNAEASARELQGSAVYPGAGVGKADGSQGWLHNGASSSDGQDVRIFADTHGGGEPHRQDSSEQRSSQFGIMADECGPQTWGGWAICGGCRKPIITEGIGTALKPAHEPIVLARKPLSEKTVAANVLKWGTGALNVDGCRVGTDDNLNGGGYNVDGTSNKKLSEATSYATKVMDKVFIQPKGRWPANIVHDGSDEVVGCFPDAPGQQFAVAGTETRKNEVFGKMGDPYAFAPRNDSGSAARFFYTAKADKLDRIGSKHPTVKPVDLMQWLCRLVTPPGGRILDPFAGSGSTGEAAWREGFDCVLIEREPEYQADIAERLNHANKGPMERKARAIKQTVDMGPLFGGANDNVAGGGQTR